MISISTNIIDELQPYILNNTNIETYLKYKTKGNKLITEDTCKTNYNKKSNYNNTNNNLKNDPNNNPNKLTLPKEHDSLFWCYYIII